MKYLLPALLLLLTGLLTACGSNHAAQTGAAVPPNTVTVAAVAAANAAPDANLLDSLIFAVNNGQIEQALALFDDNSVLIEVNQAGLLTNLVQYGGNITYTGKAAIRGWLQVEIDANVQIEPLNYTVNHQNVILEANFYYLSQVINARLDAKTGDGKFNSLTYYVQ